MRPKIKIATLWKLITFSLKFKPKLESLTDNLKNFPYNKILLSPILFFKRISNYKGLRSIKFMFLKTRWNISTKNRQESVTKLKMLHLFWKPKCKILKFEENNCLKNFVKKYWKVTWLKVWLLFIVKKVLLISEKNWTKPSNSEE